MNLPRDEVTSRWIYRDEFTHDEFTAMNLPATLLYELQQFASFQTQLGHVF